MAQLNPTVGDISGNATLIAEAYAEAIAERADMLLCSEMCVTGYPPQDLLLTPHFQDAAMEAVEHLARVTSGEGKPAMLIGGLWREDGELTNTAFLLDGGHVTQQQAKHHLPNYGVFDEQRYFTAGALPPVMQWRERKLAVLICEDMWQDDMIPHMAAQNPDVWLCMNASPFEGVGKQHKRIALARKAVDAHAAPFYYVNQVGGQDELVFDGQSFALDAEGELVEEFPHCEECTELVAFSDARKEARPLVAEGVRCIAEDRSPEQAQNKKAAGAIIYSAMKLGLRDYVHKNGFKDVVLGLSGGIDSALTAVIAADALGAEHVQCVMLPSPYTSKMSLEDAKALASNLGCAYDIVPIEAHMKANAEAFADMDGVPDALAEENLQARIRGMLLMAISGSKGSLLLTTGNKSEMAVGYATLYGDMCGAYSVLKDVYKTDVFALSRWRNQQGDSPVMPERIITRPPSAELRDDQKDEDSLPPYEILDAIIHGLIEQRLSQFEIVEQGYDAKVVARVARLIRINEFKRFQSPPGVKLTSLAFGRDRRFPLTNGFRR